MRRKTINFILKFLFLTLFSLSLTNFANAHFEPPKTLREKRKMEQERKLILDNRIRMLTIWNFKVVDGIPDGKGKNKYYTIYYDNNGNISEMVVYNDNGSIKYKDVYIYDEFFNVIELTKYSEEKMIEKSNFYYDSSGRVTEQINYSADGKIDSRFIYIFDIKNNQIVFLKYKPLNIIEYQILYKYDADPDDANNIEIIKQDSDGKLIMRVENKFNRKNERIEKKIFDENNQLMYYFSYEYFDKINIYSTIEKKSPNDEILSKTEYRINSMNQIEFVATYNHENIIISFLQYTYDLY